jgi:hypothetical protein
MEEMHLKILKYISQKGKIGHISDEKVSFFSSGGVEKC